MKTKILKKKLSNGIPVLFVKKHSTVLSFQVWVRTGSRNESVGITGITHMLEHMMFKGSKNYGPEEHAKIVESIGGETNAYTDFDETVFYENISPDNLELIVKLEADRFKHLKLSKKEFLKERKVVLEERLYRTENSPMGRAIEELFSLTFYAHPYHWPVIGWKADIENYTIEKVRDYFNKRYIPENIFIVVSGEFELEHAQKIIEKHFGNWEKDGDSMYPHFFEPEQSGERRATVEMNVNVPFIAGAYKICGYSGDDIPALMVYEKIVSGGESSRLPQELVHKRKKALYAGGGVYALFDTGIFYFVSMANAGVEVEEVEEEVLKIIENPENISDHEIEKAKNQLKAESALVYERAHMLGLEVGKSYHYTGDPLYFKKLFGMYEKVSKDEIIDVVKKYITHSKRNIVKIYPEKR